MAKSRCAHAGSRVTKQNVSTAEGYIDLDGNPNTNMIAFGFSGTKPNGYKTVCYVNGGSMLPRTGRSYRERSGNKRKKPATACA